MMWTSVSLSSLVIQRLKMQWKWLKCLNEWYDFLQVMMVNSLFLSEVHSNHLQNQRLSNHQFVPNLHQNLRKISHPWTLSLSWTNLEVSKAVHSTIIRVATSIQCQHIVLTPLTVRTENKKKVHSWWTFGATPQLWSVKVRTRYRDESRRPTFPCLLAWTPTMMREEQEKMD